MTNDIFHLKKLKKHSLFKIENQFIYSTAKKIIDKFIILCYNIYIIRERKPLKIELKYKGENIMTLKEKIKEWNETRGISVGAYLPLEKKHYVEIEEDIIILKDFDFYFPSFDVMVKTKVKGLALNSHSTRENLATVKAVASRFGNENIKFEFDFTNFILKIIINNYDEEESECVPLYNDSSFCSILEGRNKFEELLKKISNAGSRICDEIDAEELRNIFEE